MIRTLQRKFVVTAMTAITVLLLLLLGAINLANLALVRDKVDQTLRIIAENTAGGGLMAPEREAPPPRFPIGGERSDYDIFFSSNFFVVRFDGSGQPVMADVSRTSAVTEEEAVDLAEEVRAAGENGGRMGRFRYLLQTDPGGRGVSVVFLDEGEELLSWLRVLVLSAAVGLACWGLMLVFVMLLSRRAIRPIAESMEKQKQFVTNAGHEIKTPLAIIQSNTEALELYSGESKWSRNIKEQTQRLGGLISHLLLLAKMDEGALGGTVTEVALSGLTERMTESFAQPMEQRGIALSREIEPQITLRADGRQMEQLLSILLDNAVKYADEGGEIRVRLAREGRRVVLELSNTCEALPDAPPEKLFDRFYRADGARTQKSGGYGIGLSVARSLAEANRGTVIAAYLPPRTVCFTLRF